MERICIKRRVEHVVIIVVFPENVDCPSDFRSVTIVLVKNPCVGPNIWTTVVACCYINFPSAVALWMNSFFWDTAYFCPPVGANFVPGSCCCTEPNLSEDTNRKTFYKHEAVQMSLPTVTWLFSIRDYRSTFAPSNRRQSIHVGTLLFLFPF